MSQRYAEVAGVPLLKYKKKRKLCAALGLPDLGHTSYMNAVLQCLSRLKCVRTHCLEDPNLGEEVIPAVFADFVACQEEGSRDVHQLLAFIRAVPHLLIGQPHEAIEFLDFFLQDLAGAPLQEMFAGVFACGCGERQQFLTLPLEMPRRQIIELQDALLWTLNARKCTCGQAQFVSVLPRVLVMHFERSPLTLPGSTSKSFVLNYPFYSLCLDGVAESSKNSTYDLKGVLLRKGMGQYSAEVLTNSGWLEFDDEDAFLIDVEEASPFACALFYESR